jgi:hypothetical protein
MHVNGGAYSLAPEDDIMRRSANRICWSAAWLGAFALGACGGDDPGPLVGTWTYSGHVPAIVSITLTLRSDATFTFVEDVAPPTTPAGYKPDGCVTTHTYLGTYAGTVSGGASTLTWTFTGGTANAVSRCATASSNSAGTPMTADAIAGYRAQGLIPPSTEAYTVTPTTLVLALGLTSATFTKVP